MRILLITFLVMSAISASAQTPSVRQSFERGTRLAQSGQYETAITSYRQSLLFSKVEKPGDEFLAKLHYNIGVCLYQLKDKAAAVEEFTEAVKLSRRKYQKAFYALGMAQSELKNLNEAENALRAAIKIKKADGEAWFDLALVYLKAENYQAAKAAFENAVKYNSVATADAHNNIGVILALSEDFSAAEREFGNALKESSGSSVEARNNLLFCQLYRRNRRQSSLARLVFSGIQPGRVSSHNNTQRYIEE